MAKLFNDPSVTGVTSVSDSGRYMHFVGADGEVFYQTRENMQAQNRGTVGSEAGNFNITAHGVYTYTGSGGHTATISNSIVGHVHIFNGGTGALTLSGTLHASLLGSLSAGASITLWWNGTSYVP